jgi:hypothetical protein
VRQQLDIYVREHVAKYLLVRFGPVYVIGCLAASTAQEAALQPTAVLLAFGLVHVSATNGRAIVHAIRKVREGRQALLIYHATVAAGLAVALGLVSMTYSAWIPITPTPSDLPLAIWTGLFASVLTVAARQALAPAPDVSALLARAETDIGEAHWSYARAAAKTRDCSPELIQAVIAAEATQRPSWVRKLETVKARATGKGTYGVAQISAALPLSDRESIDRLCQSFQGFVVPRHPTYDWVLDERLAARLERHNPNRHFVELVTSFYKKLAPSPIASNDSVEDDGRRSIEVTSCGRDGSSWVLKGTAVAKSGELLVNVVRTHDTAPGEDAWTIPVDGESNHRGEWNLTVPVDASAVRIFPFSDSARRFDGDGDGETSDYAEVDLLR